MNTPRARLGFTLIELTVALGLFAVITSVVTTLFLKASRSERSVARRIAALDNAAFSLEQIAREARTGRAFDTSSGAGCVPASLEGARGSYSLCDSLVFTNYRGKRVSYAYSGAAIEKSEDLAKGAITGGDVRITYLNFLIGGTNRSLPRITVTAGVEIEGAEEVRLQTTVSPRLAYYRSGP